MRVTIAELRKMVREELVAEAKKKDKKDDEPKAGEGDPNVIPDDTDILFDDDTFKEESYLVPPGRQRTIRNYLTALGMLDKNGRTARWK